MKSKGFTLLEVMLVIILLVAVLFPLLQVLSSGLLASSETKDTNNALVLAQQKIESLVNSSFASIASEDLTSVSTGSAYSRQVFVTDTAANLKDVKVMVYWRTGSGPQMGITLETYISNF